MSAPEGWEDELNAAWGEVNKARAEGKRLAEALDDIAGDACGIRYVGVAVAALAEYRARHPKETA